MLIKITIKNKGLCSLLMLLLVVGCAPWQGQQQSDERWLQLSSAQLSGRQWQASLALEGELVGESSLVLSRSDSGLLLQASGSLGEGEGPRSGGYQTRDWVDGELRLQRLEYRHWMPAGAIEQHGHWAENAWVVVTTQPGQSEERRFYSSSPLYPLSAIYLVPVLRGIGPKQTHHFHVYDAEARVVREVNQRVLAVKSLAGHDGMAWQLETRMGAEAIITWIGADGLPLLELSSDGLLRATRVIQP